MRHTSWIIHVAAAVVAGQTTVAEPVPDLMLRIGVRQLENGVVGAGLHLLTLSCRANHCTLTSVTLNQCRAGVVDGEAAPVIVEIAATRDGSLRVTNLGQTLRVEETAADIGGEAKSTYLFGFELHDSTARLVGFSGGFVKHSMLLGKVVTVEYQPFPRLAQGVGLDCPVLVPGLDRSEWDDLIASLSEPERTLVQEADKAPGRPSLLDPDRGRRLFPQYDRMHKAGEQFTDDQWARYVDAYLNELVEWFRARGVSPSTTRRMRDLQQRTLLTAGK